MFQADFWKKKSFFALFWPKTVQKWPFWPKIPFFWGLWLITLNFDISFGWKLPKTYSLVPSSVFEYPNPCKNSESGIFLALIAQILALFIPFMEFWLITSVFDISFGWKLPKIFSLVSSSVFGYGYPCKNSRTEIFLALNTQKWLFFVHFRLFLEFWLITSVFDISFSWKLPKIFSLVSSSVFEYRYSCKNSEFGIFLALITQNTVEPLKTDTFGEWTSVRLREASVL